MPNFDGAYIHLADLAKILSKAGLVLNLDDQPGTRRVVAVNGDPPNGTVPVKRNNTARTLTVG